MDSLPNLPTVTKHPQYVALRNWGDLTSFTGLLPALLSPHNLPGISLREGAVHALSLHTQHWLAEMRGTL